MKKKLIIGTTIEAIRVTESELGRDFPNSFSEWLLNNNGKNLGALTIFPVFDQRDPRNTWNSIVRNFKEPWKEWQENFVDTSIDFSGLLPFAEFGTGDYYCFDYGEIGKIKEPAVVLWSHETGLISWISDNFGEYLTRLRFQN